MFGKFALLLLATILVSGPLFSQQTNRPKQNLSTDDLAVVPANERETNYYRITDVPMPSDGVMEAGSEGACASSSAERAQRYASLLSRLRCS